MKYLLLFIAASAQAVTLAWNPSTSTNVTNYVVYQGAFSGIYTNARSVGIVTNATIPNSTMPTGAVYFVVTAVNPYGESLPSNEVIYRGSTNAAPTNVVSMLYTTNAIQVSYSLSNAVWTNLSTFNFSTTNIKVFFRLKSMGNYQLQTNAAMPPMP
jgi:hypothetical protein